MTGTILSLDVTLRQLVPEPMCHQELVDGLWHVSIRDRSGGPIGAASHESWLVAMNAAVSALKHRIARQLMAEFREEEADSVARSTGGEG